MAHRTHKRVSVGLLNTSGEIVSESMCCHTKDIPGYLLPLANDKGQIGCFFLD